MGGGAASGGDVLELVEARLRSAFGGVPVRASVSFVGVEPIEVLRFDRVTSARSPARVCHVSLGMSRRPMTGADEPTVAARGPRAELLICTHSAAGDLWRRLAVLAAAPTVEGVVYAAGSTVDLQAPLVAGSRCTGGVLVESELGPIDAGGGPVGMLRLVPATAAELAWCRVHGSAALQARWAAQSTDLLDLARAAARL